eukprot:CAMPEP_0180781664 /NCGR_PEP_ID=MMETSP1038_2-20121128/47812_1 /TAXON_ID=632150 /ORGANISM="Azadinium spinosum, Strain 3D9" /LENGTH=132 /DNA_ID=CAMNT_0022817583 /DNA_START=417 /DNA_END=814 /DNA_ORIENTATION=-
MTTAKMQAQMARIEFACPLLASSALNMPRASYTDTRKPMRHEKYIVHTGRLVKMSTTLFSAIVARGEQIKAISQAVLQHELAMLSRHSGSICRASDAAMPPEPKQIASRPQNAMKDVVALATSAAGLICTTT